jgi:hypothetical protein
MCDHKISLWGTIGSRLYPVLWLIFGALIISLFYFAFLEKTAFTLAIGIVTAIALISIHDLRNDLRAAGKIKAKKPDYKLFLIPFLVFAMLMLYFAFQDKVAMTIVFGLLMLISAVAIHDKKSTF